MTSPKQSDFMSHEVYVIMTSSRHTNSRRNSY